MCCKILVNGKHEIETPAEFVAFFGFEPIYDKLYNRIVMESCLCQVDIERTIEIFGLKETSYDGEYHYLKYENKTQMKITQIDGHHFVGTVLTNFSYTLKQTMDIRVTKSDGVFTAKAGNDTYFVIGSGNSKEDAINDFYLEFHLIVVELKTFDKSISGFKKAFDFISKYLNTTLLVKA